MQIMLSIYLNSSTYKYLSLDNGVTMTSERRENINLVSFICLSLLFVKYIFFWFYWSVWFEAKECVITCKDYVIGREITTVLKISVESVTLVLCDSHNYFASSLLVKKTD